MYSGHKVAFLMQKKKEVLLMPKKSKLTEKQKRFCDFYIETGNAAEAARLAGYSGLTYSR